MKYAIGPNEEARLKLVNAGRISPDDAVDKAKIVRPLSEINERELIASLSREIPAGKRGLEIGCLYGGMTMVMALANPQALFTTIDTFEWHPADDVPSSKEYVEARAEELGVTNLEVIHDSSLRLGPIWTEPLHLVFIDGGHNEKWVREDLKNFAKHSQVVALHDYKNPAWDSVERVINEFLKEHPEWYFSETSGMIAVLRRK